MSHPRVRTAASFLAGHHPHPHRRTHRPCPYSYPYQYQHKHQECNTTTQKPFSTTSRLYATSREPTLYEILGVPATASVAEIKKQFYSLSLRHHPDRNRSDPNASARFARISSAYQVLGHAGRRAAYDRDNGILANNMSSTHSTANPGQHPMGSYSSHSANVHSKGSSYAGSKPASGLSKRRGVFRGPPPSFYAHGGYGNRQGPAGGFWAGGGAGGKGGAGAAKDEEDPTAFVDRNPLNHFNARGHYRTQSAEDIRRQSRRSREMNAALNEQYIGSPGDFAMRFVVVCGILLGASVLTGFLWPRDPAANAKKAGRRKEN